MHSVSRRSVAQLIAAGACAVAMAGTGTAVASAASSAPPQAASAAAPRPELRVPFHCGEVWRGNAWSGHNPYYAIDFNQGSGDFDKGRPVLTSGAGTVVASGDVGAGYGQRIIISHGDGWETLYAHLEKGSRTVQTGDTVAANTVIGKVGKSGGQTWSHLHYEQRKDGNDVAIRFGSNTWVTYFSEVNYQRNEDC